MGTTVTVDKKIHTTITYVRTASSETKLFDELYGAQFTKDIASTLVRQMKTKTIVLNGKSYQYYGIEGNAIILKLAEKDKLTAAENLSKAANSGKILKINEYGDTEQIKATVPNTAKQDLAMYNQNGTGIKEYGNIMNWSNDARANTFRVILRAQ